MPELILRSGKRAGRRIPLPDGEVIIGRDEEGCRIRLTSSDVSRQHCRLRCRTDGVVVTDLGSRNGTFINETRINEPTALAPGDLLRVGPFVFQSPGEKSPRDVESEITNWLMVEENAGTKPPAGSKNETTLYPSINDNDESRHPSEQAQPAATPPETDGEDAIKASDPVIQQAAEIIQGYWHQKATPG